MKQIGYYLFKQWVSLGLFCYFEKITVVGAQNVPMNEPVLFLSNHQNALMDVLLIATRSNRKPWFLTRSDVFSNSILNRLFSFLQMVPIYRLRDGKHKLQHNQATFDQCARLLEKGEAIVIFPEASHSLERRVRPLSKGFTRIIFNALDKNPKLDVQMVPVGQNYQNALHFPDRTALYIGKPIATTELLIEETQNSIRTTKETIAENLRQLTTHIEDIDNYENIVQRLNTLKVDYLNPHEVNSFVRELPSNTVVTKTSGLAKIKKFFIYMVNLPMVFLWKVFVKPRVPEDEFMATFRFGFVMLCYPLVYLTLFFGLFNVFGWKTAFLSILGHAALNLFLVKLPSITSSVQRK